MASLFVIRGNDQGSRFELSSSSCSLGRDAANTIQLHDTEVSRRHAEIKPDEQTFLLADLGSSNGTFINGRRITSEVLNSGDQVQLGATVMLFTGPGQQSEPLADKIDIISGHEPDDLSRIIRVMSHEEGSRIFKGVDAVPSPWLARARSNLQVMYRTALAVSHTLDIDQLLARIMELIFEWVEASRGCIMLINPETKQLEPKVRRTRKAPSASEKITISRSILDYVLEHNEGVLTSDAREDSRWDMGASILQLGVREAICVPMQGRYDLVGVIYIDTTTPPDQLVRLAGDKFSDEHLKLMIAIAHQAALAVEDTRYYSAMVQAERLAAIGQTIAVLSHHIKNILQGIRGGSYLIEMGLEDHDETVVRKGWDIVEKNQGKISSLVLDMLTFSKEREPELVTGDLNQVVGDVVELMEGRAAELGVSLVCQPAPDLPPIPFDAEGIHRAVLNVVTNALDACEHAEGGRVSVTTSYAAGERLPRVTVEDNGPGIPPEEISQVFTLFASTKGARGTGLGLPVSQKIMQEHGGRIRVESTPGVGSRFILEFAPLAAEEISQTDVSEARKAP